MKKQNRIYQVEIPVVGITGGIATGKSFVSRYLRDIGQIVICADQLVKNIYQEKESIKLIETIAPDTVAGGVINFSLLRSLFFYDHKVKSEIEKYIYTKLPIFFKAKIEQIDLTGRGFIYYDVPLLFEKKLENNFDDIVLVYAPTDIQLQRLLLRDKIDQDLAKEMIANQIDIEEKKKLTKLIVDNSRERNLTIHSINQVNNLLLQRYPATKAR